MMVEAFFYASEDSDADSQEIRRNAFETQVQGHRDDSVPLGG